MRSALAIALGGLLLGLGYLLSGELAFPIGLHLTWNWVSRGRFGISGKRITHHRNFLGTH